MKTEIKCYLLFCLCTLPIFLVYLPLGEPLKGVTANLEEGNLSFFDGSWQKSIEVQFEQNLPARPLLVRTHNQVQYSLGGELNQNIITGKNEVLFEKAYLDLITDSEPFNDDYLNQMGSLLKRFQDSLKNRGKEFMFISIPGKPNYFAEDLPKGIEIADTNNRIRFLNTLQAYKVDHIDMHEVLTQFEDSTGYDAFTTYGIHWSQAASKYAYVAFTEQINQQLSREVIDARIEGIYSKDDYTKVEVDLWETLNLLSSKPKMVNQLGDAQLYNSAIESDFGLCIIGDSFNWRWFGVGLTRAQIFNPSWFLYYHKKAHKSGEGLIGRADLSTTRQAIEESDLVVVMLVDANLEALPFHLSEYLDGVEW